MSKVHTGGKSMKNCLIMVVCCLLLCSCAFSAATQPDSGLMERSTSRFEGKSRSQLIGDLHVFQGKCACSNLLNCHSLIKEVRDDGIVIENSFGGKDVVMNVHRTVFSPFNRRPIFKVHKRVYVVGTDDSLDGWGSPTNMLVFGTAPGATDADRDFALEIYGLLQAIYETY